MTAFKPQPFPGFNPLLSDTKAGTNGALIAFVLDESGSMGMVKSDTIGGFNEYLNSQRKNTDETKVTLCKFSYLVQNMYTNMPISEVSDLTEQTYIPSGGTALLDAIGDTIVNVDKYLLTLDEKDRPTPFIVIMTDGEENSSRKYNNQMIKEMVDNREANEWVFMFLGANIDAFSQGSQFGMKSVNTAQYSTANMSDTMAVMGNVTTRLRGEKSRGISNDELYTKSFYSMEERSTMGDDNAQ